jgi:hypothetical protein
MDRELSFTKRMAIRFHFMMCRYCARLGRQLTRIRKLMHMVKEVTIPPLVMDKVIKLKPKMA